MAVKLHIKDKPDYLKANGSQIAHQRQVPGHSIVIDFSSKGFLDLFS